MDIFDWLKVAARDSLLRIAWMFAVAAMDAYFCDALTAIVAATVSSKSRLPAITPPDWAYGIKIPIRAVLEKDDNAKALEDGGSEDDGA